MACNAQPASSRRAASEPNSSSPMRRTESMAKRATRVQPSDHALAARRALAAIGGVGVNSAASSGSRSRNQRSKSRRHASPSPGWIASSDAASCSCRSSLPDRTAVAVTHAPISAIGTIAPNNTMLRMCARMDRPCEVGMLAYSIPYFSSSRFRRGRDTPRISAARPF